MWQTNMHSKLKQTFFKNKINCNCLGEISKFEANEKKRLDKDAVPVYIVLKTPPKVEGTMGTSVKDCPPKVIWATTFEEIRTWIRNQIAKGEYNIRTKIVESAREAAGPFEEVIKNYKKNEDPYHDNQLSVNINLSQVKCLVVFYRLKGQH